MALCCEGGKTWREPCLSETLLQDYIRSPSKELYIHPMLQACIRCPAKELCITLQGRGSGEMGQSIKLLC